MNWLIRQVAKLCLLITKEITTAEASQHKAEVEAMLAKHKSITTREGKQ